MLSSLFSDRRTGPRETPDRRTHGREVIIEFRNVSKTYGTKAVLRGANLTIRRGEVLVVLGGSGTGKSVTLRHILGLEQPDEGEIYVDGEEITGYSEEQLYETRQKFGMLFQGGALFDSMSVFENVAFPLREHRKNLREEEIRQAVQQRLELVNLPNTEHLMPVDLSGGMKKRVGLARAVVLDPQIILYDEPTTGLDPVTANKINELISDLQSKLNVTSVVVTHDIQSAFSVGDRIAFLNQGVFEWTGTMAEARDADHPMLREFLRASAVKDAQPLKTAAAHPDSAP